MKYLVLFLLSSIEISVSSGQETKFVSRGAENGGIEEYSVLKENKKVKHGTYVRYLPPFGTRGYVVLESGSYLNGEKQGVWEYYYSNGFQKLSWNKLREKGAYVNGKKNGVWSLYYLDTTTNISSAQSYGNKNKADSVNLSIEHKANKLKQAGMYLNDKRIGEWVSFDYHNNLTQKYNFKKERLLFESSIEDSSNYNLNRKPLFIGGLNCLTGFLYYNYKSTDVLIEKDSTYVTIGFTINTNGVTQEHRIIKTSHSKYLEKEILRLISSTDSNWLPALANKQKVNYEYKIRMDIIRYSGNGQNPSFRSFFTILE
jgi:antitoxin component YwqK of YwqJK toxin-antitoxin module